MKNTKKKIKKVVKENKIALKEPTENNLAKLEYEKLQGEIKTFMFGNGLTKKLSSEQIDLCIKTAQSFGLNPLKREVHFVPRAIKEKGQDGYWHETGKWDVTVIIGYEVYLKRAEATQRLNGWNVKVEGNGADMKAVITIHKKGWENPFIHEVFLREAKQDKSPVWEKMPIFQLKKVAISQGFRLAFPEEMAGLPYIPEEIGVGSLEGEKLTVENNKPEAIGPAMASIEQKEEILKLAKQAAGWEKEKVTKFIMSQFKLKSANEFTSAQAIALIKGLKNKIEANKKNEIIVEPVEEGISDQEEITPEMVEQGIPADISGTVLETDSEEVKRLKIKNNTKNIGAK